MLLHFTIGLTQALIPLRFLHSGGGYDVMDGMADRHLTKLEKELLWFAANSEAGDTFVYAHSIGTGATSIRHLALRCYQQGLILMTQKRTPAGVECIAVKRVAENIV
jgi:hypothetical protein